MTTPKTIAFICEHASAKSLIAAEYLNRLARDRGLGLTATTSGPAPDDAVPQNVVDGMATRGFDVRDIKPVLVSAENLDRADHIVSFGADVQALARPGMAIESWADCPAVSADFDVAWTFITGRVDGLVARLAG
jgi:protein-tyrosine-phosphatase